MSVIETFVKERMAMAVVGRAAIRIGKWMSPPTK